MARDVLCLLSGIRPEGGPHDLLCPSDLNRVVAEMTDEIKTISKSTPSDLDTILRESLAFAAREDDDYFNEENTWKPPGLTQWPLFDTCIAIGYFNKFGGLSGRDVELRRVYSCRANGWFNYVIGTGDTRYERKERFGSNCAAYDNPDFFVLEGCYRYLEAWLDWDSLPPRSVAFPDDAEPMSIPSEFYEIVNTREQPRSKC